MIVYPEYSPGIPTRWRAGSKYFGFTIGSAGSGDGGGSDCSDPNAYANFQEGKINSFAWCLNQNSGAYSATKQHYSVSHHTDLDTGLAAGMSVSFWYKGSGADANTVLISKNSSGGWNDGWGFHSYGLSGKVRFYTNAYTAGPISSASVADDTWHHIVGTYDGTNERLWIDGVLQQIVAKTWTSHNTSPLLIGAGLPTSNYRCSGSIDDFCIWNTCLSTSSIDALYNGGTGAAATAVSSSAIVAHFIPQICSGNIDTGFIQTSAEGNSHQATAYGGVIGGRGSWGVGYDGSTEYCINLNQDPAVGSKRSLEVAHSSSLDSALSSSGFSISTWIKPRSISSNDVISYKTNNGSWTSGFGLDFYTAGRASPTMTSGNIAFWVGNYASGYARSTSVIPTGSWTHVVATYGGPGTTTKIYINGVLEHTSSTNPAWAASTANLWIGSDLSAASYTYKGNMQHYALWGVELDATSIANLAAKSVAPSAVSSSVLRLFYNFNQGPNGTNYVENTSGTETALTASLGNLFSGTCTCPPGA